jgi:hypothetical protein
VNKNKISKKAVILLVLGLQVVILPLILKDHLHLSDFGHGSIAGIGIGLELIALILIKRKRYLATQKT